MRTRAWPAWLAVVALALSACVAPLPPMPLDVRAFEPEADERALWGQAEREADALRARVRPHEDPALAGYLLELAGLPAAGAGFGFRVEILREPTLGAFALPDGRLIVHTGLLAAVEGPAQLALILAREAAHVTGRHALAAVRAGAVQPPPGRVERGALSPAGAAILGQALPLAATAALTGHGEGAERAADAVALARLRASGRDVARAATVFARLAGEAGERGGPEIFLLGRPAWLQARAASFRALLAGVASTAPAAEAEEATRQFHARMLPVVRDNAVEDLRLGRFELARRALDRVLAAAPDDALAHVLDGDLHRLQAQRAGSPALRRVQAERARARYGRALELDPGLAAAHRQRALLHYELRELERARAEFERYLALAPEAPDAERIAEYVRELAR